MLLLACRCAGFHHSVAVDAHTLQLWAAQLFNHPLAAAAFGTEYPSAAAAVVPSFRHTEGVKAVGADRGVAILLPGS